MRPVINSALAKAVSFGSDWTSDPVNTGLVHICDVHVKLVGSATGSIHIETSVNGVDYAKNSDTVMAVNGTGDYYWNLTEVGAQYVRVVFLWSTGGGLASCWVYGKGTA